MGHSYSFGREVALFLTGGIKLRKAQCLSPPFSFFSFALNPLYQACFTVFWLPLSLLPHLGDKPSLRGAAFPSAHPTAHSGWG